MRISGNPKADLARAQTETALALEALADAHPIRQAGQLVIGYARDMLRNVPDELPSAHNRDDRIAMTATAAVLYEKARQLKNWWLLKESAQIPSWMDRKRTQTEAEFFDTWIRELARLPYGVSHGFFGDHPRDTIDETYRTWLDRATRRQIRQRHLPIIAQSMAITATLDGLTSVARLSSAGLSS